MSNDKIDGNLTGSYSSMKDPINPPQYLDHDELYPFCCTTLRSMHILSWTRNLFFDGFYQKDFERKIQKFLREGKDDLEAEEIADKKKGFVQSSDLKKICSILHDYPATTVSALERNAKIYIIESSLEYWAVSINDGRIWNNETNLSLLHGAQENFVYGELTCKNRWIRLTSTNELPLKVGFNFLDLLVFVVVLVTQSLGLYAYIYSFDFSSCNNVTEWKSVTAALFCVVYLSTILAGDMHRKTIRVLHDLSFKVLDYQLIFHILANRKFVILLIAADLYTQVLGITASVYTVANTNTAVEMLLNFTVIGTLMSLDNLMCGFLYIPDVRRTLRYKDETIHRAIRFKLEHSLNITKSWYLIVLIFIQFICLGAFCGYLHDS